MGVFAPLDSANHPICRRILNIATDIHGAALLWDLPPYLLAALVAQESAGDPYALRVERGFWRRYGAAILALVARTPSRADDHWARYPDLAAASYGLCQVIYSVAVEAGVPLDYPTQLCNVARGLSAGARILKKHLIATAGDTAAALGRYNGDRTGRYATRVLAWRTHLVEYNALLLDDVAGDVA